MKKVLAVSVLFVGSFTLAFSLTGANMVHASTTTINSDGCVAQVVSGYPDFFCSIPRTNFDSTKLTAVYFDFISVANYPTQLHLRKYAYTGTIYEDSAYSSSGNQRIAVDYKLIPSNVKANPSYYDYLAGWILTSGGGIGVTVVDSN